MKIRKNIKKQINIKNHYSNFLLENLKIIINFQLLKYFIA